MIITLVSPCRLETARLGQQVDTDANDLCSRCEVWETFGYARHHDPESFGPVDVSVYRGTAQGIVGTESRSST